jgi:hypothetical protein
MLPDKSKEHGFGRVIRWAVEITSHSRLGGASANYHLHKRLPLAAETRRPSSCRHWPRLNPTQHRIPLQESPASTILCVPKSLAV